MAEKRAWYGKGYYFVELPRRFMVSIWGIPVFWKILPEQWMGILVGLGCLAFDIFITSRAPDLQLTKEEVQRKLASGGRLYFLTVQELKQRLIWVAVGFAAIALVAWYWFSHGQEPVLFARVATAGIVLAVVAYVSALGIPLRTKEEIPEGETPFTLDYIHELSKRWLIYMFGWPVFLVPALFIFWIMLRGLGGLENSGTFSTHIYVVIVAYTLLLVSICTMPMAVFERKITLLIKQEN